MATADNPQDLNEVEKVDPTFYIPKSTQDNYLQMARDAAAATGGSAKDALGKLADDFRARHDTDPVAGWDHLAEWADDADPDEAAGPSALAVIQSRALESARRDPSAALHADQAIVAEAVAAVQARTATTVGVGNDPSTGVVANPGPIPVETTDASSTSGDEPTGPTAESQGETSTPTLSTPRHRQAATSEAPSQADKP